MQLKTLVKSLDEGSYGWGLAAGAIQQYVHGQSGSLAALYANVPASLKLFDGALVAHANLGLRQDRLRDTRLLTWGLALEHELPHYISIFGEAYGDQHVYNAQTGFSYALLPEQLQIDLTMGRQFDPQRSGTVFSVGIVITPAALW